MWHRALLTAAVLLWGVSVLAVKPHYGPVSDAPDWLIEKVDTPVTLDKWEGGALNWKMPGQSGLLLTNGLVSRVFLLAPDFATIDFHSTFRDASLLRAIKPEAVITLSSSTGPVTYNIGGLTQSHTHAYMNRTDLQVSLDADAFHFVDYATTAAAVDVVPWTPGTRHSPKDAPWPPPAFNLAVKFAPPASAHPEHADILVTVVYEMYRGAPLLSKWVTIDNTGDADVVLTGVTMEYLAVNSPYAPLKFMPYPGPGSPRLEDRSGFLYAEGDVPHLAAVQWQDDVYTMGDTPPEAGAGEPVLNCTYSSGPDVHLRRPTSEEEHSFVSFRCQELVTDTDDKERFALSIHQKTRLLAPWTQENPLFMHLTDTSEEGFKLAVDQLHEIGFEMIIYSFGSGFKMESSNQTYLDLIRSQVEYANARGIEVGGYDLIVLDRGHGGYGGNVGDEWVAVAEDGSLTLDACFASGWTDKLEGLMYNFLNYTGLSMVETDGPYGGNSCASTKHSHHEDWKDSAYHQTQKQSAMYKEMRRRNVYVNTPDYYWYSGGNKAALGYNENQYSLPRWEDLSISRQDIWEGTYDMIPTQGWMQVPLVEYHAGGDPATFEPLKDHLQEYQWALAQYMGYGVQPCWRGKRMYDGPESKALVTGSVAFFKKYRAILTSNLVHVRRPDMQGIDSMMHVNPHLPIKGLAMVFNPTDEHVSQTLRLPTYYTGLSERASVRENEGTAQVLEIRRDYVDVRVALPPRGITFFTLEDATPRASLRQRATLEYL